MRKEIKICYPCSSAGSGGSNISTLLLAEKIMEIPGYEPVLIYPEKGPAVKKAENKGLNYKIIPVNFLVKKARALKGSRRWLKVVLAPFSLPYFLRIGKYLAAQKPDIIHTNDSMSALLWGMAGKILGIKTIWHIRQERTSLSFDKIRLLFSDEVVFVASSGKKRFSKKALKRKRHTVIYNGVDLKQFYPRKTDKLKKELGLSNKVKLVGFVGRLCARKRPEMFVKAGLEVLKHAQNVHFVIVGDELTKSGYLERLKNTIRENNAEKHFSFLGHRENISAVMAELDIFVFTSTSRGEAFPRVVIEAMACGVPVVSTKSAGVPEAVKEGETGFLVEEDDLSLLADKTKKLLENSLLAKKMGEHARKRAVNLFDAKVVACKVVKEYKTLLKDDNS